MFKQVPWPGFKPGRQSVSLARLIGAGVEILLCRRSCRCGRTAVSWC
jgi:hypothetical protein